MDSIKKKKKIEHGGSCVDDERDKFILPFSTNVISLE